MDSDTFCMEYIGMLRYRAWIWQEKGLKRRKGQLERRNAYPLRPVCPSRLSHKLTFFVTMVASSRAISYNSPRFAFQGVKQF